MTLTRVVDPLELGMVPEVVVVVVPVVAAADTRVVDSQPLAATGVVRIASMIVEAVPTASPNWEELAVVLAVSVGVVPA